ncbi:C39 family peptidase [Desulfosporosinus sp. OT]|uniref:C39 family peptidase n=1 Tax=Desulfosporosinus sp. OT TaxID=913865 RepID=UPI00058F830E|nr:C39 family peptidase [Desulfosporosinus sp. OT]
MVINLATVKLLAQVALKLASDEEARKRLLIIILTPLLCVVLILTAFVYILTHPLEFLGEFFDSRAITEVERLQNDYGMYQYLAATGYESGVTSYEGVTFTDGATPVVYYNQRDERFRDKSYGTDNIGGYGCGPSAMAMVISSLSDKTVDPVEMAEWSYDNGYWAPGGGSYHSLIPGAAKAFGLQVEGCSAKEPQKIVDALSSGKLVVALMGKGHFTSSGHFIVLRGVTAGGKILVADPASKKRSEQAWDLSIILNEAHKSAEAGGPFWIISQ